MISTLANTNSCPETRPSPGARAPGRAARRSSGACRRASDTDTPPRWPQVDHACNASSTVRNVASSTPRADAQSLAGPRDQFQSGRRRFWRTRPFSTSANRTVPSSRTRLRQEQNDHCVISALLAELLHGQAAPPVPGKRKLAFRVALSDSCSEPKNQINVLRL
jgi:hypothetical protein